MDFSIPNIDIASSTEVVSDAYEGDIDHTTVVAKLLGCVVYDQGTEDVGMGFDKKSAEEDLSLALGCGGEIACNECLWMPKNATTTDSGTAVKIRGAVSDLLYRSSGDKAQDWGF